MTVKYSELKVGDMIKLKPETVGWECLEQGRIYVVFHTQLAGLFVKCSEGSHFLRPSVDRHDNIPEFERVSHT